MKRTALGASVLALVVALTGCGTKTVSGTPSGESFTDAQELVRAASSKTAEAKSSKFTFETALAGQKFTGQGAGRYDGANTAMQMSMDVGPVHEEILYVDGSAYIQLPEEYREKMTGGKPWGKLDPNNPMAKSMGASTNAEQNDPSKYLDQIQEAGTIKRNEQTTLDGQPVTHYWIDVDLTKVMNKLADSGYPQEMLDLLKGKTGTIPLELWLNQDLLPVKITEDLGSMMKAMGAPSQLTDMTMTMTYTDWGTPVTLTAPPADQVGDLKLGG
ncbi:hypothetical protein [Amycolatopsis acididurans]|uniref:hypothetical protein n=1 Tax=Amycolatopsis acididurans TaxID=2724524 RepID=UPI001FE362D6|nr:hypothetical protein [Amycolatopsis acididurans]